MFLFRLSLTLYSRLNASFHLNRQPSMEGMTSVILLTESMTVRMQIMAAISAGPYVYPVIPVISVAAFCLVSHVCKQRRDLVPEISLYGYLSVFGRASHSAFYLQRTSEGRKVFL